MTALLAALAATIGGVLLGERLGPSPAPLTLGVAAGLLAAALARRGRSGAVLAVVGCAALGTAVSQRALHGLVVSPLAGPVAAAEDGVLVGTLVEDPAGPRFAVRALVRAERFGGRDAGGRTVRARASGPAVSRLRVLQAGDRVVLRGRLGPLTGYDERFRWRHAVGRFDVHAVEAFAPPRGVVPRLANAVRDAVLRGGSGLPARERALLAGFLVGDTRNIDDATVDAFRASGLSHLLAVSGANVAFVLLVLSPVLGRLRTGGRFVGGVATLVLFGAMTRWEPSVLRASAMAGLVMLATLLGRPAAAGRVLALAALGLLVADPFLLHSVGFLLSCGASAGIVALAAPIATRLRGPQPWREALAVTLAAQVGVLPVLLPVFGTVPLVALPANLLAVPVVGPLTVWGLVAGVVGGVLGPAAARVLQAPTFVLVAWVRLVATTAARVPIAVDGRALLGLGALAALIGAGVVTRRARREAARRLPGDGRGARGEGHGPDAARPSVAGAARPPRR